MDAHEYQVGQTHWHTDEVAHLMPSGPDAGFLLRRWDEQTSDSVAAAPAGAMLDVGCGNGRMLTLLTKRGWRVCGVDPSSRQLQEASERLQKAGIKVDLVRAVAEYLPFKDAAFDVLHSKSAIDHITDREAAMTEFPRVLGPSGRAVISAVSFGGVSARLSRLLYAIARRTGVSDRRRRPWDTHVPVEHTFEGTYDNIVELCTSSMDLVEVYGVSLFFALPRWGWLLAKLPKRLVNRILNTFDRIAYARPKLADVVVCVVTPRTK